MDMWLALVCLVVLVVGVIVFPVLIWRSTRDRGYDASMPHGTCMAQLGRDGISGMTVTCGVKTNHFDGKYWYCRQHPPQGVK